MTLAFEKDAAALSALHKRAFPPGDGWSADAITELLALDTTHVWAWSQQGALRGFVMVQLCGPEADILTLAVDPNHRRKGIAKRVMATAHKRLLELGTQRVLLEVAETNSGARAFYRSMGYATIATREAYYKQAELPPIDAIIMAYATAGQLALKQA